MDKIPQATGPEDMLGLQPDDKIMYLKRYRDQGIVIVLDDGTRALVKVEICGSNKFSYRVVAPPGVSVLREEQIRGRPDDQTGGDS